MISSKVKNTIIYYSIGALITVSFSAYLFFKNSTSLTIFNSKKIEETATKESKQSKNNVTIKDVLDNYEDVTKSYGNLIANNKPLFNRATVNKDSDSFKSLLKNDVNMEVNISKARSKNSNEYEIDITNTGMSDCRVDLVLRSNNKIFIVVGGSGFIKSHSQVTVSFDKKSEYYDLGATKRKVVDLTSLDIIASLNNSNGLNCYKVGTLTVK